MERTKKKKKKSQRGFFFLLLFLINISRNGGTDAGSSGKVALDTNWYRKSISDGAMSMRSPTPFSYTPCLHVLSSRLVRTFRATHTLHWGSSVVAISMLTLPISRIRKIPVVHDTFSILCGRVPWFPGKCLTSISHVNVEHPSLPVTVQRVWNWNARQGSRWV